MEKLSQLPNIGKMLEEQLNSVGINTLEELRLMGAKASWLKIQEIDESACLNKLLALEGAIQNINKNLINEKRKTELKEFYYLHKK